jgi:hypothetical protein
LLLPNSLNQPPYYTSIIDGSQINPRLFLAVRQRTPAGSSSRKKRGFNRGDAENAEEELREKRQKKRSAAWPVTFSRRTCPPRVASETATTAASRGDAENAERNQGSLFLKTKISFFNPRSSSLRSPWHGHSRAVAGSVLGG